VVIKRPSGTYGSAHPHLNLYYGYYQIMRLYMDSSWGIHFDAPYTASEFVWDVAGSRAASLFSGAKMVVGTATAASSKVTGPSLTIDQGTDDGPTLVLKSTGDVNHDMTTYWDTSTYGSFGKYSAGNGGLMIDGVSEGSQGLSLRGIVTTADETHSAGGAGCVEIVAWLKDGTTIQAPWGSDNILAIRAGSSTRAIFTASGDLYLDANQHAYAWDEYDDCQLVRAVELHRSPATIIRTQFDEFVRYNRQTLEEAGLIRFNDDGHHFINLTGMNRLISGAVWQLYVEKEQLKERVEALEQEIKLLKAA